MGVVWVFLLAFCFVLRICVKVILLLSSLFELLFIQSE